MKFKDYLKSFIVRNSKEILFEWKVKYTYSGREIVVPDKTILWIYLTNPITVGLIWTDLKGYIYNNKKRIGKMIKPDHPKASHKRQLAEIYEKIGLSKVLKGDKRQNIENIYEQNVRGRIIGDTIYVWDNPMVGINDIIKKKLQDKAIDAIYKYIDEGLVT